MNTASRRVSICIPLFNGAATIAELLESIRKQSYQDFHVVMADDASTDATVAIVESFLSDPRFELIRREKNIGFYENLSELIEAVPRTDFLIFPGQDDVWRPTLIQRHIEFLDANPRVGVVHSRCSLIDENGDPIEKNQWYWERLSKLMTGVDLIEALLTHNFVCFPAAMIRRLAFDDVKQEFRDQKFTYVPDWWLWLLIAGKGWNFGYLAEADCCYRMHPAQLSQTLDSTLRTAEMSLVLAAFARLLDGEKFGRELSKGRRSAIKHLAYARLLRRGLAMQMRGASKKDAAELLKTAWRNDPLSAVCFPFFFCRYIAAKLTQHHECSGMPELFHPLGNR